MHVVDVTWKPTGDGFLHGLTYWDGTALAFLPLRPGDEIAWTIKEPRCCIGRRDENKEWVRCPSSNIVLKKAKCSECQEADGFDSCIRCTGFTCNASRSRFARCESSKYVVYLAFFADGSLKVGVSSEGRELTRWVEQGADFAAVVARVIGGHIARRLEHDLGKVHGIKMAIPLSRKVNSLLNNPSYSDAETAFYEFLERANCELCLKSIEVIDLRKYYHLQDLDAEPSQWPDNRVPLSGQQIIGTVLGMKGNILVTYIGHAFLSILLKKLIGYALDDKVGRPIHSQTGLLDFI